MARDGSRKGLVSGGGGSANGFVPGSTPGETGESTPAAAAAGAADAGAKRRSLGAEELLCSFGSCIPKRDIATCEKVSCNVPGQRREVKSYKQQHRCNTAFPAS